MSAQDGLTKGTGISNGIVSALLLILAPSIPKIGVQTAYCFELSDFSPDFAVPFLQNLMDEALSGFLFTGKVLDVWCIVSNANDVVSIFWFLNNEIIIFFSWLKSKMEKYQAFV